jgi:NAD(P)-dependent dehydrogenase (short-subunit alcohol dehydrogenase family)
MPLLAFGPARRLRVMPAPVLLLTGASRGIGHAIAKRFADNGWRLLTVSREGPPPGCGRDPERHLHFGADLANPEALPPLVADLAAALGNSPLHALVNNAGISPKPEGHKPTALSADLAHWREVLEVNLLVPVALARAFGDRLEDAKTCIVNVTSIAGHRVHPFAGAAYAASKAALLAATRELAAELAPRGIRVNAVAPGEIATPMIGPEYDVMLPDIPMGRFGTPAEVAGVVWQLCQPDFSYVTGTEVFVTGGQHVV